jgi:hypothetical protein
VKTFGGSSFDSGLVLNEPAPTDSLNRATGSETEVFNGPVDAQDNPLTQRTNEGGTRKVGDIRAFPKPGTDISQVEAGYTGTLTWPDGSTEPVRVASIRRMDSRLVLQRVE